ncbi:hypothetical protein QUA62_25750 [Microcoleus sp. MON1_C1]
MLKTLGKSESPTARQGLKTPARLRVLPLLKLIAIFLRSQTDKFAESLAKVTLVVKPDLLRDIGY